MQQLIYNQRRVPERYGLRSMASVGCGPVATYNALSVLDDPVDLAQLICRFQRQLPGINGVTGTFIMGPAWMLHRMGYRVKLVNNRKHYDELAKNAPVCILSFYWRQKKKFGAHFVALRYVDDHFEGYNTYRTSYGPDNYGPSLDAFLTRRHYFGTVLTVIEGKK